MAGRDSTTTTTTPQTPERHREEEAPIGGGNLRPLPPVARRRSSDGGLPPAPPPSSRSSPNRNAHNNNNNNTRSMCSPSASLTGTSRKRLESIDEGPPHPSNDPRRDSISSSTDPVQQHPFLRHLRIHSDEISLLSLGSAASSSSTVFEQEQRARFLEHTKKDLEQRLAKALPVHHRRRRSSGSSRRAGSVRSGTHPEHDDNDDDRRPLLPGDHNDEPPQQAPQHNHSLTDESYDYSASEDDEESVVWTEREKQEFIQKYLLELEKERETLLVQWKAEWEVERRQQQQELIRERFGVCPRVGACLREAPGRCLASLAAGLATMEVFLANLPLTIGAVGLSWVTMGTVWFKFMEEMVGYCTPVHYYAPQCTFPEFPGCFRCETTHELYKWAVDFHLTCSTVAGACCLLFVLKALVASRVVADELSNPTTSTPMGLVCIATVCVFAGQWGVIGETIVLVTSVFHFLLAFWFLYMAVFRFGLWPDPGWFPNTVGLTYAAVKTFLYLPNLGLILLAFAVAFFFSIFFVSVARVALNQKIAAPVAWIGLSAPSITMYALTLVSQPTRDREALLEQDPMRNQGYHDWMVSYYLPFQHLMMVLSLIGLASAASALVVRWESFKKKPFSPAHVAFCFPTLAHTNAVQAYRGAINAFSDIPPGSPFKIALFSYWLCFLVGGTILNLVFTYMYVRRLPQWTKLDTAGEEEPPAPEDTFVHEMLDNTDAHEMLDQPFVNPAVLQANEAGALVRVRRGTADYQIHGPYVRSRRVKALGFDPTMDDDELRRERAQLLDWVAKNAPRKRNRTMSNPLFLGQASGSRGVGGQSALYGTFGRNRPTLQHKRSSTTTELPGV